jgi:hypothetical protein
MESARNNVWPTVTALCEDSEVYVSDSHYCHGMARLSVELIRVNVQLVTWGL